jgi:hypothetical protein
MVYDNSLIILIFALFAIPMLIMMMFELNKEDHNKIENQVENPHLVIKEPLIIPENTTITRIDSPELIVPPSPIPRTRSRVGFCSRSLSSSKIDVPNLSCDCDYWLRQKSRFPKTDPRRICGHLWDLLNENSFSRGGFGNEHLLFPLTSKNYLLSTYKINNKIVQIMSKGESPWVEVVAQNRSKDPKYDHFGYQLNEKRWAGRRSPNSSPLIKIAISMHRVEFLSTDFETLPEVPEYALLRRKEILEESRAERNYHKKNPHHCYVCRLPIDAKGAKPLFQKFSCQHCGKTNVLVPSGNTNTPERVALYNKYNGNYSKDLGSIGEIEKDKDQKLYLNETYFKKNEISEEVFKIRRKKIKLEANKKIRVLEKQKDKELDEIKKVEKIHRQRVKSNR